MTAKWTEVTETTVPARVEREETEFELWTHKRSAHRCHQHPATPTEIGRGLQALEPAERAEALEAAGVEPTPPATPEEIGEVLAGLEPDERAVVLAVAGVPTPDELDRMRAARDRAQLEAAAVAVAHASAAARLARERDQARAERDRAQLEAAAVAQRLEETGRILARVQGERDRARAELAALREALNQPALGAYRSEQTGSRAAVVKVNGAVWLENVLLAARRAGALP